MLTHIALLALQLAAPPAGQQPVYVGRAAQLQVSIPRVEADVEIDGSLSEPVWRQAALLTGFSQYQPVDGRAAEDSTEVLVWYDSHAIYFGIRAFEAHGSVHATLADRDKIDGEDYVQILLDPFNDRRRAWIFGVNPLGVQADGIRTENAPGAASGPGAGGRFENVDLNPDFVFTSKGHVTDYGYEVEIRVPFKSIRYQSIDPQNWALNVLRNVQHSGYQDSWVPARRANASFLAQSGTLKGLTQLHRGLVLDLNPFSTLKSTGAPSQLGNWHYDTTPAVGGNARWGMTTNLTLDATANPDFSQVEADVGQVTVNERFAVFFPEKRPFFLEGIENFDTPNQLIYMRQIINPDAGAKLTDKLGSTNVAYLSAVDGRQYSVGGENHPIFNLVRLRRDVGAQSTVGVTYTDRTESGRIFNRVASADARLVFAKLYYLQLQGAGSFTDMGVGTRKGSLFEATADRTGRHWGFHYTLQGFGRDFRTQSGYVPRTNIVGARIFNRLSTYGAPGALLESFQTFLMQNAVWKWQDFFDGRAPLETSVSAQTFFTVRGGWSITAQPAWNTTAFDPDFYASYAELQPRTGGADTVAYVVPDRISDLLSANLSLNTPRWPTFSGSIGAGFGGTTAFFEPGKVNSKTVSASLNWRPTERVRVTGSYAYAALTRPGDGTRLSTANIPRLKLEYQLSRPLFVRFVGQYQSQEQDALRDPRNGYAILTRNSTGTYVTSTPTSSNHLRVDWLLSYRPTPGTVVFAGYGSGYNGSEGYSLQGLNRTEDGFFFKVSYLFRM